MPAGKDAASSIQPAGQILIWDLNDSDGPEKVFFPFERRLQKYTKKRGENLYFFIGVSAWTTARSGSEHFTENDSVFVNQPQKEYVSEVGDFVNSDSG